MIVSNIEISDVKDYLRTDEETGLEVFLNAAKGFVKNYTGLTDEEIDKHEDISAAVFALIGEMYDNRVYTVQTDKVNPFVKSVLDMYSVNLI